VATLLIAAFHWASTTLTAQELSAGDTYLDPALAAGLWDIGRFFFKVGAFTFGGGITTLAFMQDQVVNQLHWLTQQEFLDGLALGQLTPGPILMLAAYVGYKLGGMAGAVVGGIAIFLPAFILMLSVLPVLNRVRELVWIRAAMRAISAAVIGIISVSLMQMAPHAAPDAFTAILMVLTVAGMLIWSLAPLPLMLGGGLIGIGSRMNLLQRLKELT
jgi:chromate transporter